MCIGIPMQIIESGEGYAHCEGMGNKRTIDTLLVGEQPPGTWLLVFLNSAREILSTEDAARITDAVRAIDQIMATDTSVDHPTDQAIDTLFADLVDREPPKPPSLLALEQAQQQTSRNRDTS